MTLWIWWVRITFIGVFSLFLLMVSIFYLKQAYELSNPLEFVVTFFSQCLMLMIATVGIIYTFFQVHQYFKKEKTEKNEPLV